MRRAERRKYRLPSWVIRPCPDGSLTHKKGRNTLIRLHQERRKTSQERHHTEKTSQAAGEHSQRHAASPSLSFLPFFPVGKAAKRKREGNTDKNKFIMKREIILSGAEKGYALSWSAFTRASRAITISMTDETGHRYFTLNKADEGTGHYAYKFLGEGSDTCAGNQLKVSIENSYPEELQTVVSATQIYGSDGRLKGISYTVCAEDYTDANFSDFCLNVVAWVK